MDVLSTQRSTVQLTSVLFVSHFIFRLLCSLRWNMICTQTHRNAQSECYRKIKSKLTTFVPYDSEPLAIAIWLGRLLVPVLFHLWNFLAVNAIKLQNVCAHVFFHAFRKLVFIAAFTSRWAVPKVTTNSRTKTTLVVCLVFVYEPCMVHKNRARQCLRS